MQQKQFSKLCQYLTQPNPEVRYESRAKSDEQKMPKNNGPTPSKSKTRNKKYPTVTRLGLWDDFTWATLAETMERRLEEALERDIEDLHDFSHIQKPFLTFRDENALESVLIKFHQSIVLEALDKTPEDLLEHRVKMVRGGQARLLYDEEDKFHPFIPDWAAVCLRQDDTNILPGESKHNWGFQEIVDILPFQDERFNLKNNEEHTVLWPIRQIMWYCALAHARYGYIISEAGLIVVMVDFDEMKNLKATARELRDSVRDTGVVKMQHIPWTQQGIDSEGRPNLTILLALWALHLLAANHGRLARVEYTELGKEQYVTPAEQVFSEKEMTTSSESANPGPSQDSQQQSSQGPMASQNSNASYAQAKIPRPRMSRTSINAMKRLQDSNTSECDGDDEKPQASKKSKVKK